MSRALVGIGVVLALQGQSQADGVTDRALAVVRSPDVTVAAGAVFPLFLVYEAPGPWVGVSVGWEVNAHVKVVASADVGTLFADGSRRYLGSLGTGVRVSPWRQGPWIQLGLGMTAYVERIGVVLPDRMVRATDTGAMFTGDLSLGVRVRRWELAVGYDRILRTSPYYKLYDGVGGDEAQPFDGTAMVWVGRQL